MKKKEELAEKHSCLNKAGEDEIIFVLLQRDKAAPGAIRAWCAERVRIGKNTWDDPQIKEALICSLKMQGL